MSKRSKQKVNELMRQHGYDPNSKPQEELSPKVEFEIGFNVDDQTRSLGSNLIKSQLESNQPSNPNKLLLKDLLSINVNLVDEIEANNPNVRQECTSGEYLKFSSKLDLKIPSDEQNILNSPQDCLEILEAIKPLARIILSSEFDHEKQFYIGDRMRWYKSSDNNISREKLLLEIKLKTLYLITKTARIANEFLIKPKFTLEEFKQLVKTTTSEANLNKVNPIKLTDLSEIIKGISRIFPEINNPLEINYESRIVNDLNYMVGGGAITSGCKALRDKNNWDKTSNGKAVFTHKKATDNNSYIYHYINDFKNPQEINFLPFSEAEQILDKFGVYPALFHLILAVHFYRQSNPLSAVFHLRGTDLIKDLGLHKRTDLSTHQKLTKVLEVVTAVRSLVITAKWSSSVKVKSGKRYKTKPISVEVEPSIMWDISPKTTTQKDLLGNEELTKIDIVVKSGVWLSHFFNEAGRELGKALYNFATFSRKILELDPYHEELALRIALLQSTMDYRQYYTVEQWLIENLLGAKHRISKAKKDQSVRKSLTKLWDKTLLALERIGYTIHYDQRTYPQELRPTSPRKPRGYFERLLEAKIQITPQSLDKPKSDIEAKAEEIKPVKPLPKTYTGKELKQARQNHKPKISQKMVASCVIAYDLDQYNISRIESKKSVDPDLAKAILKAIRYIKNNYPEVLKTL